MDERFWTVIRKIHAAALDRPILWAFTGSVGMALQGMPLDPHDVDVQTDREGAYAFEALFPRSVKDPVHYLASERMRSHLGRLEIDGITVEIMGNIEKLLPDGTWEPPVDVGKYRHVVTVNGLSLPVLSLAYEAQAYRKMGRIEKADLLDRWLVEHPNLIEEWGGPDVTEEVNALLNEFSPEIQDLSLKLRDLIFQLVPEASERVYPGWKNIGYSLGGGMKNQFCAVAPLRGYVNLYFMQGSDLPDPDGLLEGTGKKMRHVKVRSTDLIGSQKLSVLIQSAAALCKKGR